jgi:hypothetical protein
MRAALLAMMISGSAAASVEPREPLPNEEVPVVYPHAWLSSPINLWDIGLVGSRKHDVVGTINGREIHMNELDEQSVGAFQEVAKRIFSARDRALNALVERRAIERAGGLPALHHAYDRLALSDSELGASRFRTWSIARSVLVHRQPLSFDRFQVNIFDEAYRSPSLIIAAIDSAPLDRATIDRHAGTTLQLARREYFTLLVNQWDKLVTRTLREGHPIGAVAPPSETELKALYEEQPAYASDRERAVALLLGRKRDAAQKELDAKLRATASIEFFIKEPAMEPIATDGAVAPITVGSGPLVTLFQAFGCLRCSTATKRAASLSAQHTVTIVDFASPDQPGSIRGAMAVRCAYDKAWPMAQLLADDPGSADLESLAERATRVGVDRAQFVSCMQLDRFMPELVENTKLAARVMPEPPAMAIPFFYRDGVLLP